MKACMCALPTIDPLACKNCANRHETSGFTLPQYNPIDFVHVNKSIEVPDCTKCKHRTFDESGMNLSNCIAQGLKETKDCYGTIECYRLYKEK